MDTSSDRYLRIVVGNEDFALPLLTVREVIAVPQITSVPYSPPHFKGIMNVRGQIISVIDLRTKLGLKSTDKAEPTIVICHIQGSTVGLIVDRVESVMKLSSERLLAPPAGLQSQAKQAITHIFEDTERGEPVRADGGAPATSHLVLVLELSKLLSVEDYSAIKKAA